MFGDLDGARQECRGQQGAPASVHAEDDIWVEHLEECCEVTGSGRGEECGDDAALRGQVRVGGGGGSSHSSACSARELPGRLWGAVDDRRYLGERHPEHVVEHEGEPL